MEGCVCAPSAVARRYVTQGAACTACALRGLYHTCYWHSSGSCKNLLNMAQHGPAQPWECHLRRLQCMLQAQCGLRIAILGGPSACYAGVA